MPFGASHSVVSTLLSRPLRARSLLGWTAERHERQHLTRRSFLTSLLSGTARAPTTSSAAEKSPASKPSTSPLASLLSLAGRLPRPPLPPLTPPHAQTLTARRVLPYPAHAVYALVADVGSYARFVPYCSESVVTEWTTYEPVDRAAGSGTTAGAGHGAAMMRRGGGAGAYGEGGPESAAAATRYPSRATLRVGFGALEGAYASTVVCHPGLGVVEALSGPEARSALSDAQLTAAGHGRTRSRGGSGGRHVGNHGAAEETSNAARSDFAGSNSSSSSSRSSSRNESPGHDESSLFLSLETCWTVHPTTGSGRPPAAAARADGQGSPAAPTAAAAAAGERSAEQREWSDVGLRIRFRFANPLYAAVSAAAADRVAAVMIAAFERRARDVLGGGGGPVGERRGSGR